MFNLDNKLRRSPVWSGHFDRDLERFFDSLSSEKADFFAPNCEVLENEKEYRVSLDIPGLKQEEIEVEVKENALYISGERKVETKSEKDNVLKTERRYGKFSRVFTLPANVSADGIEAKFEHGVLDIHIPKEVKAQTKKIIIGSASATPVIKN